jgi:hypothetical protein
MLDMRLRRRRQSLESLEREYVIEPRLKPPDGLPLGNRLHREDPQPMHFAGLQTGFDEQHAASLQQVRELVHPLLPRRAGDRELSRRALSIEDMRTIERWVLRIADHDLTWIGFNWMRPAKESRCGPRYVLLSSLLLSLPGILIGTGLIYCALGTVTWRVWSALFALALATELALHAVFAHYWNRRADTLAEGEVRKCNSVPPGG